MTTKTKTKTKAKAPQSEHGSQGSPAGTAQRDAKVLAFIRGKKAGRTLAEIQAKFGYPRNIAYLSVRRGLQAGNVEKVRDGSRTPRYVSAG